MTPERAINLVTTELRRAEAKHPGWPENRLRQVAIMVEEAGESLRAALMIIEKEERCARLAQAGIVLTTEAIIADHQELADLERELEAEVVSTAAMALRWLLNRKPLYAQDQSESRS